MSSLNRARLGTRRATWCFAWEQLRRFGLGRAAAGDVSAYLSERSNVVCWGAEGEGGGGRGLDRASRKTAG